MIHWVLYKASDSTRHPCTPNPFSGPHGRGSFTRSFDSDALQYPDWTPLHHRQNPSDTHDPHQPKFSKAWLRNFNNWAEPYVAGTVPDGNVWSFWFFLGPRASSLLYYYNFRTFSRVGGFRPHSTWFSYYYPSLTVLLAHTNRPRYEWVYTWVSEGSNFSI